MKPETLRNIVYSISLATQLLLVFIPFFVRTLFDRRRKGLKRVRPAGWLLIFIGIISFVTSIATTMLERSIANDNDAQASKELKERDELNQQRISELNTNVTKELAKYGLKYDSAKEELARIHPVVVVEPVSELTLCSIRMEYDSLVPNSYKTFMMVCAIGGTAYNCDIALDILLVSKDNSQIVYNARNFEVIDKKVSINPQYGFNLPFRVNNLYKGFDGITVFRMKGTFSDSKKKEYRRVNKFFTYNHGWPNINEKFGSPHPPLQKMIDDFLAKNNDL